MADNGEIVSWTALISDTDSSGYNGPFKTIQNPSNQFDYIVLDRGNLVTIDDRNWRVTGDRTVSGIEVNSLIYLRIRRESSGGWEENIEFKFDKKEFVDFEDLQCIQTNSIYNYYFPIAMIVKEKFSYGDITFNEGVYQIQFGNIQHFPDTYRGPFAINVNHNTFKIFMFPGLWIQKDNTTEISKLNCSIDPETKHYYVYLKLVQKEVDDEWVLDEDKTQLHLSDEYVEYQQIDGTYLLLAELDRYFNSAGEVKFAVFQHWRKNIYETIQAEYNGPFKIYAAPTGAGGTLEMWVKGGGLYVDTNTTNIPNTKLDYTPEDWDSVFCYVVLHINKLLPESSWTYEYKCISPNAYSLLRHDQFNHYYIIGYIRDYIPYQRQYGDINDMTDNYNGPFAIYETVNLDPRDGTEYFTINVQKGYIIINEDITSIPFKSFDPIDVESAFYVEYDAATGIGEIISDAEGLPFKDPDTGKYYIPIGLINKGFHYIYQLQYGHIFLGGEGESTNYHFKGIIGSEEFTVLGGNLSISSQTFGFGDTEFAGAPDTKVGKKYYIKVDLVNNSHGGIEENNNWPDVNENERLLKLCEVIEDDTIKVEQYHIGDIYADEYKVQCMLGDIPEFLKYKIQNNTGAVKSLVMNDLGVNGDKKYIQLYGLKGTYATTGIAIELDENNENWVFYAKIRDIVNIGDGVGLFKQINDDHEAEFKTLTSIDNSVIITSGVDTVNLKAVIAGENVGGGYEIYIPATEDEPTKFRTLSSEDESVQITYNPDNGINLTIAGSMMNIGSGARVWKQFQPGGCCHEFRTIKEHSDESVIHIIEDTEEIKIDCLYWKSIDANSGYLQLVNDQTTVSGKAAYYGSRDTSKGWYSGVKQKIITNVYVDGLNIKYDYIYGYVLLTEVGGTATWAVGEECD